MLSLAYIRVHGQLQLQLQLLFFHAEARSREEGAKENRTPEKVCCLRASLAAPRLRVRKAVAREFVRKSQRESAN